MKFADFDATFSRFTLEWNLKLNLTQHGTYIVRPVVYTDYRLYIYILSIIAQLILTFAHYTLFKSVRTVSVARLIHVSTRF